MPRPIHEIVLSKSPRTIWYIIVIGLRSWLNRMWALFFACISKTIPSRFLGAVICWYRKSAVVDTMSCSTNIVSKFSGRYPFKYQKKKPILTVGTEISTVGGLVLDSFRVYVNGYGFHNDAGCWIAYLEIFGFFIIVW